MQFFEKQSAFRNYGAKWLKNFLKSDYIILKSARNSHIKNKRFVPYSIGILTFWPVGLEWLGPPKS